MISKMIATKKNHSNLWLSLLLALIMTGCAKMGSPDGGWYDETPPRVIGTSPADGSTGVKSRKIHINFNEFVTIDNATEKVVVSPPQMEAPEIKSGGKHIEVTLKDSLKPNTTYTIDFSDAISDNNEGNPLGNYTYSFSTGDSIDYMQVAGYVLEASNLEPVKGILVGLYSDMSDSAFIKEPMVRVSRTDSRGHFEIKGVACGNYRIYALQDADGDYRLSQLSEQMAFSDDTISPTSRPDIRQDTIWRDSLHIDSIARVAYTHYLPDDIVLTAFTPVNTNRYYLKAERTDPDHFTLFFSYGHKDLPVIRGLNFNADRAFIVEPSANNDTITYWLTDTALVNQDTLRMEMEYMMSDSLGQLVPHTDTLDILPKISYERRLKLQAKAEEKWQKEQDKKKQKGQPYESRMPVEALKVDVGISSQLDPDKNIRLTVPKPLLRADSTMIHLYDKHDTLWYQARFRLDKTDDRHYTVLGEWRPGIEYSLEIDSTAFEDIYGHVSDPMKIGFKVRSLDDYATILMSIDGFEDKPCVVQLLSSNDEPVKQVSTEDGQADFYYVMPGTYYMRMFVDENGNGRWDTGDFSRHLQAEPVYYYHEAIECKAKWDVSLRWNPTARRLNEQKPGKITKQKADQQKKIKSRNLDRAKRLGIQYIPKI